MRRLLSAAIVVLAAATALPLRALEWKATQTAVSVPAGAKQVHRSFAFRNQTSHPVRILSVETSCHCTEAEASATTIAPGAAGEIRVTYTVAGQAGHQEKHIYVQTDESDQPDALDLLLDIGK